eukprot:3300316-Pleurochrysis_carterae.AAC.2
MAIFASPPCSSFSVSRFFKGDNSVDGGPPPVRDRDHVKGLPHVPPAHARELAESNEIIRRTTALLRAAHDAGAEFILEHPADRGASNSPIYLHGRHAPLWLMPDITALKADSGAVVVTFPQCALGATAQKDTSLLCSRRVAPMLQSLSHLRIVTMLTTDTSPAVLKPVPDGTQQCIQRTLRTLISHRSRSQLIAQQHTVGQLCATSPSTQR